MLQQLVTTIYTHPPVLTLILTVAVIVAFCCCQLDIDSLSVLEFPTGTLRTYVVFWRGHCYILCFVFSPKQDMHWLRAKEIQEQPEFTSSPQDPSS